MRLGLLPTWAPSVPVMSQWLKLGGVPAPVDQWFTARYVHLAMIGPLWRRRMGFRRIYCVEVKTKYRCKLLWIGDCRCILTVVRLLETLCERRRARTFRLYVCVRRRCACVFEDLPVRASSCRNVGLYVCVRRRCACVFEDLPVRASSW